MSEQDNTDKQVESTLKYSIEQFDKSILFIASGAIGISFAFIKDLVPCLSLAIFKGGLFISLVMFSVVIFLNLVGHFISTLGSTWARNNFSMEADDYNKIVKKWNRPIRIINITTIVLILIASILLMTFIYKNI